MSRHWNLLPFPSQPVSTAYRNETFSLHPSCTRSCVVPLILDMPNIFRHTGMQPYVCRDRTMTYERANIATLQERRAKASAYYKHTYTLSSFEEGGRDTD
jgi:hypothetical protein